MRALLELLGLAKPDPSRREPVALPAWIRRALRMAVPALAVASAIVYGLVRVLVS